MIFSETCKMNKNKPAHLLPEAPYAKPRRKGSLRHGVVSIGCKTLIALLAISAGSHTTWALAQSAPSLNVTPTYPVAFRGLNGIPLSSVNSNLPVSAEEGLWQESRGLPNGSQILLTASKGQAPANGADKVGLKIELFDAKGQPYLLATKVFVEVSTGVLESQEGTFFEGMEKRVVRDHQLRQIELAVRDGVAQLVLRAPSTPGDAIVKVTSGAIAAQGTLSFVPDLRDLMGIGVIEGALNINKFRGPSANDVTQPGFSDSLRNWSKTSLSESDGSANYKTLAGRAAFFFKGTVKGEYLLTAAADSDKITAQKMFRDIDPNAYYPVFGDTSTKDFEAQSTSPVFVRVEKNKNYLLYGDYMTETGDQVGRLSSLGRTLTGAKANFENDSVRVTTFVARTANKTYVDEQPGRGISGPYSLGKANALVNTEIVEIIVRDKSQPSIVLSRKAMTRFVDYDFEPFSGRILFRQPISSVDENGNFQYIRISYAVEDEFAAKHWVGGVNGKVKLGDHVTVGVSYAKEDDVQAPYQVGGASVEVKLGEKTYFFAEVAQSEGTTAYNQSSQLIQQGDIKAQSGGARKVELRHESDKLKARAYAVQTDAGFQNAASGVAAGKTDVGANISLALTPQLEARAAFVASKDQSGTEFDGAERQMAAVSASYKVSDRVKLEAGVTKVKEILINGSTGAITGANLTGGDEGSVPSWGFNGTGLLASPGTTLSDTTKAPERQVNEYTSAKLKALVKVTDDASVNAEVEQAIDDASKRRIAVGLEVRLDEKSRIYALHELQNTLTGLYGVSNDGTRHANTIVGISSALGLPMLADGQVYGEYRSANAFNGRDVASVAGIRNTWHPREGLGLTAALERQVILSADGTTKVANALSLASEYAIDPSNQLAGKLELRQSDTQDQVLSTLAYTRVLSNDWSALAKNTYARWQGVGDSVSLGTQTQNQFQLGLAYRDTQEGRLNGLFRIEHRLNQSDALNDPKDEQSWIASLHGNYKLTKSIGLMGQLAAKRGSEVIFSDSRIDAYRGALASARVIWDISDRFDASAYGSIGKDQNQTISGVGAEVGVRVLTNLWLSAGYTKGRFADVDTFSANTSWSGWHVRLRYKFDETSFKRSEPGSTENSIR